MRDVLDTGHLRTPRLGHTHSEDRDLAAVLAVARLEDPAIAVAPGSGPAAAVTHGDAGALGERFEVTLHLRARGVVRSAVHHRAHERAARLLFGKQAVPVVALVLARVLLERRIRLGPGEQTLEERPLAEHPAGVLVGRDRRVLHAESRERVADLQAAGSAADENDRIVAGWVRSLRQPPLRVAFASLRASATRMR